MTKAEEYITNAESFRMNGACETLADAYRKLRRFQEGGGE